VETTFFKNCGGWVDVTAKGDAGRDEFERFVAETSDGLLRAAYLPTHALTFRCASGLLKREPVTVFEKAALTWQGPPT
jgi:hypothetical protein